MYAFLFCRDVKFPFPFDFNETEREDTKTLWVKQNKIYKGVREGWILNMSLANNIIVFPIPSVKFFVPFSYSRF